MLRHDDVSEHDEAMLLAYLFEALQKQISPLRGAEPGFSLMTTASDEVEISGAVISLETFGHEEDVRCTSPRKL